MKRGRSWWFLLTGLLIGALGGAGYAWLADPVQYVEVAPYSLKPEDRDEYRALIAAAYTATGDLARARARLELLPDGDPQQALAAQAQRIIASQGSYDTARSLALLAVALSQPEAGSPETPSGPTPAATTTSAGVEESPVPTSPALSLAPGETPAVTTSLAPTVRATLAAGPAYAALDSARKCDAQRPGLLQVQVAGPSGAPVFGAPVVITWPGGEDRFFTGLNPDAGAGYADFEMAEGTSYSVRIGESGEPVNGITTAPCPAESGGGTYLGGWEVVFRELP